MASSQETFDIARPQKRVTFGLIVLALFLPWLALYLDGSSWPTVGLNFAAWLFFPIVGTAGAIIHAIICLCRTDEHRKHSKPARRRLHYEKPVVSEPESKPAPVTRAVTEPSPAPVMRAATEEPTTVERVPTEPLAKRPSATSSSPSVSSSDVEKESTPAPPQSTAPAPPQRTATAKKEENPFVDPAA